VLALPASLPLFLVMAAGLDITDTERTAQCGADKTKDKETPGTSPSGRFRRCRALFEVHVRNPARSRCRSGRGERI
jgi:hypothetical protein